MGAVCGFKCMVAAENEMEERINKGN